MHPFFYFATKLALFSKNPTIERYTSMHDSKALTLCPIGFVHLVELPRGTIVFQIGKHVVQLTRSSTFFHHLVLTHLNNDVDRVDVDRTSLSASVTGGTRPQLFG